MINVKSEAVESSNAKSIFYMKSSELSEFKAGFLAGVVLAGVTGVIGGVYYNRLLSKLNF